MNCNRPGCNGVIDDGYCSDCGFAPAGSPSTVEPPEPSEPSRRVGGNYAGSSISTSGLSAPSASVTTGPMGSRGTGRTRATSRGNLGAGLVEIPPVPHQDPASVILPNPEVPEQRRFCGSCGEPVGRSHNSRPGRTEGFCPYCQHPFSFTPKLETGELVAGQYEVVGCIAHGGLGWIYLARDQNVDGRWVVLKGLLDTGDASAMAAAIAERRFLSEVRHPNIVTIFNFVEHGTHSYIVMEYVGGKSLKELRQHGDDGRPAPLPVAQAIAFILEILPALGYLHARSLLFCDFKPDNVIQDEEEVKLIDLGGVHRLDDDQSDLWGTVGYQAPEISVAGPSVSSDLYTVGRTLAVLSFDFHGSQDPNRYASSLPPAREVPVFERYPSFHRFLLRATAFDPDARFQSASDMAEQLVGVLRQVVATDGGHPAPAPSERFTGDLLSDVDRPAWTDLPVPQVDPGDPGASTLANLSTARPDQLLAALEQAAPTLEIRCRLARARLELGDLAGALEVLDQLEAEEGVDWRSTWWRAVWLLAAGRFVEAGERFSQLADALPGELAPLVGCAGAAELEATRPLADDPDQPGPPDPATRAELLSSAADWYQLVSATDPSSASASFGLSRVRALQGDRQAAAQALEQVPATSIHFTEATAARCRVLAGPIDGQGPTCDDLVAASGTLDRLKGNGPLRAELTRELLASALHQLQDGASPDPAVTVAGSAFTEPDIRVGLEQACRSLAVGAASPAERVRLIDDANRYRPRSLV